MWEVRLYKNTGMNTANTVDKGSRLNSAEHVDVPPLEILQGEHLAEVRVKATRAVVKDVDYMRLTDTDSGDVFYYAVDPFMKTSIDVTTLKLTPDAVMTAAEITNGIENVEFGDGIVERHHVAKNDDVFGAYTEPDPLLIPSKELQYDKVSMFDETRGTEGHHLVESTMSLVNMANQRDAVSYLDAGTGGTVVVPQTVPALEFTNIYLGADFIYKTAGTEYYDHAFDATQTGISRIRSLGAEGCILNSWIVPDGCCEYTPDEGTGIIMGISGTRQERNSGIHLAGSYNVRNKRLTYGELNMIKIMSPAAGTSMEFLPEDLAINPNSPGQVVVTRLCDPRPNGMPYFYPKYFKGVEIGRGNWLNVVPGMQWANAPLVYTGRSGSTLTEIRYRSSREYATRAADLAGQNLFGSFLGSGVGQLTGAGAGGIGFIQGALRPELPPFVYTADDPDAMFLGSGVGMPINEPLAAEKAIYRKHVNQHNMLFGLASTALNSVGGVIQEEISMHYARNAINEQYRMTATKELQELALATQVRLPELVFPRSETVRDFVGNGIIVLKYFIQDSDAEKLDKVLEMYGYRDTAPLEKEMFTNRSKFNYISAKAVTVTDKRLPLWLRELLAAQLKNGVRIWHQLPDATAYTDGSNT